MLSLIYTYEDCSTKNEIQYLPGGLRVRGRDHLGFIANQNHHTNINSFPAYIL